MTDRLSARPRRRSPTTTSAGAAAGPGFALEGLRVLSFAEQYPGPFATLVLADLGAAVTLVERPPTGDPSRRVPSFFEALNRGKRSIALDLKTPGGVAAARRLAEQSDVLFEGFRPGTLTRLGLGYDALAALNPGLVYVSLSGFGQDGPYRDLPGHDLSYQALSGFLHRELGEASPRDPAFAVSNPVGGLFGVIGALTALRAREVSGRGAYVDVALFDSLVSLMTVHLVPTINGNGPAYAPPEPAYGLFRTADGRLLGLSIVGEDHYWSALCELLGMSSVARLPFAERLARRDALVRRLRRAFLKEPLAVWTTRLHAAAIPFSPVLDLDEVPRHPQVRARGTIVNVDAADGHPRRQHVRQPVRIAGYADGPRSHAPRVGEHTRDVLAAAGYGAREVEELLGSGAAFEAPRGPARRPRPR